MTTVPLAFWEGLGVGLLASAVGSAVVWWYLRQRVRGGGVRPTLADPTPRVRVGAPSPLDGPAFTAATSTGGASVGSVRLVPVRQATAAPVETPRKEPPTPPPPPGQLKISHRVLLHIASQGQYGPHEVPPRALTQAGMVEVLEVNQGALTGVLRRLVAAGVLEERREHVRGADRRLKVYRLTSSGAELSRAIRTRRPP